MLIVNGDGLQSGIALKDGRCRSEAISMSVRSDLHTSLQQHLHGRKKKGSLRTLHPRAAKSHLREFSSNDYLDLASSPILRALFTRYLESQSSLASTGSRLLSGNSEIAEQIEQEASRFWKSPDALLCSSGYEANVSIFSTIPQAGDCVIYDEFIHASVHVGMKTSRATKKIAFKHNDITQLKTLLNNERNTIYNVFLAVETVYSMDGDTAPLLKIIDAIRECCPRAHLILDEAHATGLFGPSGQGLATALDLDQAPEILMKLHTFGKGAGSTGAIILCDSLVKQYLLNYAKGLIYSTFMSVPAMCLVRASLTMLVTGQTDAARHRLWERIRDSYKLLAALPATSCLTIPDQVQSAIIPILSTHALELSDFLEMKGFRVLPVRYPTVPRGSERVRICLRSDIPLEMIEALVAAIREWILKLELGNTTEKDKCKAKL